MEALDETVRRSDSELSVPRSPERSTSRLSSCMSPIANTDQSLPPTIDNLDRVVTQQQCSRTFKHTYMYIRRTRY